MDLSSCHSGHSVEAVCFHDKSALANTENGMVFVARPYSLHFAKSRQCTCYTKHAGNQSTISRFKVSLLMRGTLLDNSFKSVISNARNLAG